jgi:hypothetical protein
MARQVSSNVTVMVKFFFYVGGFVHHEFLHRGQRVYQWYYLEKNMETVLNLFEHTMYNTGARCISNPKELTSHYSQT